MVTVYISASNQVANMGVGEYGTEQDRMHQLADRVKYYLEAGSDIKVLRNTKDMSLGDIYSDCNTSKAILFIDNHTNAGPSSARGLEVYYSSTGTALRTEDSRLLADRLFKELSLITPTEDRGVKKDISLFTGGLYVLRNTSCPAALIEHIFHTNIYDVAGEVSPAFFIENIDKIAKAEAFAIYVYLGLEWTDPDKNHPAEGAFNYLNDNGVKVSEKRYTGPITRGDTLELLARLFSRVTGIARE